MKRTLAAASVLTALLLSLLLPVSAAVDRWQIASAYCQSDTLYTYVQIPEGQENMEVSLKVGQSLNGAKEQPELVADGDTTVHYLLLIDLSTSMAGYRSQVQAFAQGLLSVETQPVQVDIAGLGSEFMMFREGLTTQAEVQDVLSDLLYRQTVSDISGGMKSALQHLADHPQQGGTLLNLILLTDGVPYGTKDSDAEADDLKIISEALQTSPEIVVHTVGFTKWDDEILAAFSGISGEHHNVRSIADASEAGSEVSRFTDGLYRVVFPLDWPDTHRRIDAQLVLTKPGDASMTMIAVSNIRNLDLSALEESPEPSVSPVLPAQGTSSEDPGGTESDAPPDGETPPAPGEETESDEQTPAGAPTSGGQEPSGEEAPDSEKPSGSGEESGETPDAAPAGPESPDPEESAPPSCRPPMFWFIIGGAALLTIAVVVVLCIRARAKKKAQSGGIAMRLEILAGQCRTSNLRLTLSSQLTFGSEKHCDVVFPALPPQAAKITFFDQTIYLEETDPQSEAAIGGMRIHGPNRLRSGDEISLGAVRFRLFF